jgi:hypothetical protein
MLLRAMSNMFRVFTKAKPQKRGGTKETPNTEFLRERFHRGRESTLMGNLRHPLTPRLLFQPQRGCALQPRVARNEPPWVADAIWRQPQRGCETIGRREFNRRKLRQRR